LLDAHRLRDAPAFGSLGLYSEYLPARKHGAGRFRRALSVSDEEEARPVVNDLANRTY
jgi:hypothetical protein